VIRRVSSDWKTVYVTPVFRRSKKEDPDNYRPVSLTSVSGNLTDHRKEE